MLKKIHKIERTCVGCFKKDDQGNLLAVTRLKSGEVVVNFGHKFVGRSVYLCRNQKCLKKAKMRKGKNGVEFGLKVKAEESLWRELERVVNGNS